MALQDAVEEHRGVEARDDDECVASVELGPDVDQVVRSSGDAAFVDDRFVAVLEAGR